MDAEAAAEAAVVVDEVAADLVEEAADLEGDLAAAGCRVHRRRLVDLHHLAEERGRAVVALAQGALDQAALAQGAA